MNSIPDLRPEIVISASPHQAHDAQYPQRERKRSELCKFLYDHREVLKSEFRFKATRGLYAWIHGGYANDFEEEENREIYEELATWRIEPAAYFGQNGGVVELANEIVAGRSRVVLLFIANADQTGVNSPANQSLARICDYKNVPIYFNYVSGLFWAEGLRNGSIAPSDYSADEDPVRSSGHASAAAIPVRIPRPLSSADAYLRTGPAVPIAKRTVALISHNHKKERMRNFVLSFERTLQKFDRIITTGTTGAQILQLVPSLRHKLLRYESGPHGGDIRIAFEILAGVCHDVVFFMDPLHIQAHLADIRVLTLACNQVGANLVTNHTAARDWITMLTRHDHVSAEMARSAA